MSVNKFCTLCKNELDTIGKSLPPRTVRLQIIFLIIK